MVCDQDLLLNLARWLDPWPASGTDGERDVEADPLCENVNFLPYSQ